MKFYLAPLEGVTGHVFYEAYDLIFHNIDQYFTPFISANDHVNYKTLRELGVYGLGENNPTARTPQILGNDGDKIIELASQIRDLGDFDTINLNFGCPSGTVTAKNRGSGIFKDLSAMDRLLDYLFSHADFKISLKTRIGWASADEWPAIVEIYRKYPFSEIIIHPRVRADMYVGACKRDAFEYALDKLDAPLCYNGDIWSVDDFDKLCKQFPTLDRVMIGRPLVADPLLIEKISLHNSEIFSKENDTISTEMFEKRRSFVKLLEKGYMEEMKKEGYAIDRLKEFWSYFGRSFPESEGALKELRKARTADEYRMAKLRIRV